jgi:hypothetical protein
MTRIRLALRRGVCEVFGHQGEHLRHRLVVADRVLVAGKDSR